MQPTIACITDLWHCIFLKNWCISRGGGSSGDAICSEAVMLHQLENMEEKWPVCVGRIWNVLILGWDVNAVWLLMSLSQTPASSMICHSAGSSTPALGTQQPPTIIFKWYFVKKKKRIVKIPVKAIWENISVLSTWYPVKRMTDEYIQLKLLNSKSGSDSRYLSLRCYGSSYSACPPLLRCYTSWFSPSNS